MGAFEACEAALFIDNCSGHMSADRAALLTRERVRIVIFTSDKIQNLQMLDMMLFDALKKHATGLAKLDEESQVAAFLLKVCRDFKQTMVEVNKWRAFAVIGFTHNINQILYELLFDQEKFP
jgi:hypothetical protein